MIIKTTETKKAIAIEISFEEDCEFNIHKEIKQLSKRLRKENCFYPWYIFKSLLLNTNGWIKYFKDIELNDSNIYDFVKNNYEKEIK